MNVIHIFNSLKFSGAEIMYVDAAKYFQEYGCDLSVVATHNELGEFAENFKESGYEIFHYSYPKSFVDRLKYTFRLKKLFKERKIDVVHIHSSRMMFHFSFIAWLVGIKSVYTFHNVFPTKKITRPYHILKRRIAKYIFGCTFQTISDSVYNNELTVFKNDTIKINNWYGMDRYFPATNEEKNLSREKLRLAQKQFVIISVGGCSHIKRHSEIIKAISLIKDDIPNLIYLHLGTGTDEEIEKKLAEELNVYDKIHFVGNQQDVRKYLIASDLYIMPSKFEGISITTIEAMACKIPTILYDVPGLRDFNTNGKNSLLIEPDYKILAQSILDFYKGSIDMNNISNNAKLFVDRKYNIRKNSKKIFDLYE